jgi:hypothetical protein
MGTLVATYSEEEGRFYVLGAKLPLDPEGVRRVRASPMRYCLGANILYIPADQEAAMSGRLCWARIKTYLLSDFAVDFGDRVEGRGDKITGISALEEAGVFLGDRYVRRWKEENGQFVPVPEFCSQTLIDALADNPEILSSVSHHDFEDLCAEIFARRGFKVDLFRRTGDGGIDFLALQDERTDPIILAVQVKQPEERSGKSRRSVGRPVVQQIYGAAKAWDLNGSVMISGSTYSAQARVFADLKPNEMRVHNGRDVLDWVSRYRWNEDELR